MLRSLHHVAIICSDYQRSRAFYTDVLGFTIVGEVYRQDRKSWKLDHALQGRYVIELFSFENPPPRVSRPEAAGLRHLAFEVESVQETIDALKTKGVACEPVRTDEFTGKQFTFFVDPDNLPIEIYGV